MPLPLAEEVAAAAEEEVEMTTTLSLPLPFVSSLVSARVSLTMTLRDEGAST